MLITEQLRSGDVQIIIIIIIFLPQRRSAAPQGCHPWNKQIKNKTPTYTHTQRQQNKGNTGHPCFIWIPALWALWEVATQTATDKQKSNNFSSKYFPSCRRPKRQQTDWLINQTWQLAVCTDLDFFWGKIAFSLSAFTRVSPSGWRCERSEERVPLHPPAAAAPLASSWIPKRRALGVFEASGCGVRMGVYL